MPTCTSVGTGEEIVRATAPTAARIGRAFVVIKGICIVAILVDEGRMR